MILLLPGRSEEAGSGSDFGHGRSPSLRDHRACASDTTTLQNLSANRSYRSSVWLPAMAADVAAKYRCNIPMAVRKFTYRPKRVTRHMRSAPPSPDTSERFRGVNEEEVECHYSPQCQYRVIISRDRAGLYRVHRERWNTGDWDIAGVAFWCRDDKLVTITDAVESARKLVAERLSEVTEGAVDAPNPRPPESFACPRRTAATVQTAWRRARLRALTWLIFTCIAGIALGVIHYPAGAR